MSAINADKITIYRFRDQIAIHIDNTEFYLSPGQANLLAKNLIDASFDVATQHFSKTRFIETIIQDTH